MSRPPFARPTYFRVVRGLSEAAVAAFVRTRRASIPLSPCERSRLRAHASLRTRTPRSCLSPEPGWSQSARSACMTSTRDARAAGISDARIAAATRTTAAPTMRQRAGHAHVRDVAADDPREREAADHAGHDTRARDHRAFAEARASAGAAAPTRSPAGCRTRASARSPRTPARRPRRPPRWSAPRRRSRRRRARSTGSAPAPRRARRRASPRARPAARRQLADDAA